MPYWGEALNVTDRFVFWYLALPGLIAAAWLPAKTARIDRLALGLTSSCAVTIVTALTLAALKLYEPLTLWGLLFLPAAARLVWRSRSDASWGQRWLQTLDRMEDEKWALDRPAARLFSVLSQAADRLRLSLTALRHPDFSVWLIGLAVLAWSAWLRYSPYLRHAFLGAYDGYVHLAWVKYLETNQLFRDGIYPYGYHAILSVLGSLNFLDRLLVLRFAGPIGGTLLVLSTAFAAHKLGLRPAAVVTAAALIGLGVSSPLPAEAFRQTQPLPQEFAAVFVLPGAACAWLYLRNGDRVSGWLAIAAVFLTASIHTYASVFLILSVAVLTAVGLISLQAAPPRAARLYLASAAAALLGLFPLAAAHFLGLNWHQPSAQFVTDQVQIPVQTAGGISWTGNLFLDGGLILGATLAIGGSVGISGLFGTARQGKDRAALALALGFILGLLFTQAHGRTGLHVLVGPTRSGLFFSLFLALASGLALDLIWTGLRAARLTQAATALAVIGALVINWWPKPPGIIQLEYDEAVESYLEISRTLTRNSWHIVSPTEQYSQVMGAGYHEQLGAFLRRVTADQVRRPDFKLYLPSPNVFVFVEKWPLASHEPTAPDAWAPLTMDDLAQPQVLNDYYSDPARRSLLQSRIWGIMEAYRENHPEKVSVYRDSPRFRVYRIRQ